SWPELLYFEHLDKWTLRADLLNDIQVRNIMILPDLDESADELEVGDVDGDGIQDFLTLINGKLFVGLRVDKKPDMLQEVVTGTGQHVSFFYDSISNPAVYRQPAFHEVSYPERPVNGGIWVVKTHSDGDQTYEHTYEHGVEDVRGR